jgi:hypothetical protein
VGQFNIRTYEGPQLHISLSVEIQRSKTVATSYRKSSRLKLFPTILELNIVLHQRKKRNIFAINLLENTNWTEEVFDKHLDSHLGLTIYFSGGN